MTAGHSGIRRISRFPVAGLRTTIAGTIDFVPVDEMSAPALSQRLAEFVIDEANIYYFDDVKGQGSFGPVALMKIPKNGGTPVEIDRGNAGWIRYLAVDAKQIYFTDISKVYAIAK